MRRRDVQRDKVETIIGKGSKIDGKIYITGSLRVEGRVEGEVKAGGDVFVGEEGLIVASVQARNIIIAGEVQGNVDALEKLENIVRDMERGEMPLDSALKSFEEGIRLIRFCSAKLEETQRRVDQLLEKENSLQIKKFQDEDTDE